MRKLILSLVFIFATGVMINANTSDKKRTELKKESAENFEEFGCYSDCNTIARQSAIALSSDHTDRSTGGELFHIWNAVYGSCLATQC
jgi:hypothetical protein